MLTTNDNFKEVVELATATEDVRYSIAGLIALERHVESDKPASDDEEYRLSDFGRLKIRTMSQLIWKSGYCWDLLKSEPTFGVYAARFTDYFNDITRAILK